MPIYEVLMYWCRSKVQRRAITPFMVIQNPRCWYQSKAYSRLPISD